TNANEVDFDLAAGATNATPTAGTSTKSNNDGGKLEGLDAIDVTTDAGAAAALTAIEGFLSSAIDAAAEFGSKQKRLDNQADFVSSLADSLKTGISTLVDADLEETSARLQALQVQQQLGVQALSIANQAPQSLLSLFR
ncbi:MAG: flagellin, partial [Litorimonas sp.]